MSQSVGKFNNDQNQVASSMPRLAKFLKCEWSVKWPQWILTSLAGSWLQTVTTIATSGVPTGRANWTVMTTSPALTLVNVWETEGEKKATMFNFPTFLLKRQQNLLDILVFNIILNTISIFDFYSTVPQNSYNLGPPPTVPLDWIRSSVSHSPSHSVPCLLSL